MSDKYAWGAEMVASDDTIALESMTQGPNGIPVCSNCGATNTKAPYFRPVNIIAEKGQYYVTLYACHLFNGTTLAQTTAIWFQSLKPTDRVNISVSSLLTNVPPAFMIDILGAILASPAKIRMILDQVVMDHLAYFYMTADEVDKRYAGALFIPSYVAHREQDMAGSSRAVHDVFKRLVNYAQERNILTAEEANNLHRGVYVAIPQDRFLT